MNNETQLGFIHRFIPSNKNQAEAKGKIRSTTILLLHGTGGNEEDMIPLAQQIAPEAAILSPRGKVLENGMPRFFRRIAEGVFDMEISNFVLMNLQILFKMRLKFMDLICNT
jgi:phospholipase/carboxylesterase